MPLCNIPRTGEHQIKQVNDAFSQPQPQSMTTVSSSNLDEPSTSIAQQRHREGQTSSYVNHRTHRYNNQNRPESMDAVSIMPEPSRPSLQSNASFPSESSGVRSYRDDQHSTSVEDIANGGENNMNRNTPHRQPSGITQHTNHQHISPQQRSEVVTISPEEVALRAQLRAIPIPIGFDSVDILLGRRLPPNGALPVSMVNIVGMMEGTGFSASFVAADMRDAHLQS